MKTSAEVSRLRYRQPTEFVTARKALHASIQRDGRNESSAIYQYRYKLDCMTADKLIAIADPSSSAKSVKMMAPDQKEMSRQLYIKDRGFAILSAIKYNGYNMPHRYSILCSGRSYKARRQCCAKSFPVMMPNRVANICRRMAKSPDSSTTKRSAYP